MRRIEGTDLEVCELCLGTNSFGWTADQDAAFAILDAYVERGGNFLDTADVYARWVPGNVGGESETIIGNWMAARGNRSEIILATKVGKGGRGLSKAKLREGAEDSLARLRTDYIDLYYAHDDDPDVPLTEALGTFDELVKEGKVREIAASNFTAERLEESLGVSEREGFARYVGIQPNYNLVHRDEYEPALQKLCMTAGLGCFPYYGLASGFLTGKYTSGGSSPDERRATAAKQYLDERGIRVLGVLESVAARNSASMAATALAWLAAQPGVVAPIASVRAPEQLDDLFPVTTLALSPEDLERLDEASR